MSALLGQCWNALLPLMNEVFRRDVRPLLGRFADLAERDDACLNTLAEDFFRRHKPELRDGSLRESLPEARANEVYSAS